MGGAWLWPARAVLRWLPYCEALRICRCHFHPVLEQGCSSFSFLIKFLVAPLAKCALDTGVANTFLRLLIGVLHSTTGALGIAIASWAVILSCESWLRFTNAVLAVFDSAMPEYTH